MAEKLSAKSAWKLNNALKKSAATKPTKVGTARVTRRDSDGSVWVRLPGSNVDTPVNGQILSDAQIGDTVSVRIENGRLSLMGNASTPSVGQQQVNTTVQPVQQTADNALETASTAQAAAELATSYAAAAQQSATDAETYARQALGSAQDADRHATEAKADALAANTAAQGALLGLSTVEDVVDTLTWITKHGTMTLTTDTTVDPSKVYFTPDASGQYVVGGSTYSIVQNPTTEGLSTYYELTINKSVENYIATHVAVTNEGLWLTPTSSNGYRVLIATGAGTAYTTAGTYIVDGSGITVAKFAQDGALIGKTGQSRAVIDYHSLQLADKDGNDYFHVSDLRDASGVAQVADSFVGDGDTSVFFLSCPAASTDYTVTVSDGSGGTVTKETLQILFVRPPSRGSIITVEYETESDEAKAYTIGTRGAGVLGVSSVVAGTGCVASGKYSYAEGWESTASEWASHAEGYHATASGIYAHAEGGGTASSLYAHAEGYGTASNDYAHAEGSGTTASGFASHAEGSGTIAASDSQTAIGKYNEEDANGDYAIIIGNGAGNSARSNALTVGWDGNVLAQAMAGIIQMFAGATPPTGWLECDGQEVSRTTYAVLFAAIGTTWGAGDGSTTFNLPDLRGRGPIGDGSASGLTARTLGGKGGSESIQSHTHGFTNPKIPNHVHSMAHTHTMAHTHNSVSTGRAIQYNYGSGSSQITTGVTRVRVAAASSGNNYVPRVANADADFSGITNTGGSSAANTGASSAENTGNPTSLGHTTGGSVGAVSGATTGSAGNMQPFAVVKFIICTGKTS